MPEFCRWKIFVEGWGGSVRAGVFVAGLILLLIWSGWGVTELGPTQYDDSLYLERSLAESPGNYLRDLFTQPVVNLWHPLSVLSHDVLRKAAGQQLWVHHFANVLLHLLAGGLLARWLTSFSLSKSLSFLLAMVWVVHPLAIEPTAWISGRKEVLLAVFALLALVLNQNPKRLLLVYGAVGAAFLCKPTAIVLPLLLMVDCWVKSEQNATTAKSILLRQGWLLFGSLLLVWLTLSFQAQGPQNLEDQRGCFDKLVHAGWALRIHLQHFFWPRGLHVGYLTPLDCSPLNAITLPLMLLLSMGLLFRRSASTSLRVGLFMALLFLLPTLGLIRAGNDLVTDRYAYVPMAGLVLALAGLFPRKRELWVEGGVLLVVTFFVLLSVRQRSYWRDTEAIFTRTLQVEKNHSYAEAQLGALAVKKGKPIEAKQRSLRALELNPLQPLAHNTLGNLAEQEGDFATSKRHYESMAETWSSESWVYARLAILAWNLNEKREAKRYLDQAAKVARVQSDREKVAHLRKKLGW